MNLHESPHNTGAEQTLLGITMMDAKKKAEIMAQLSTEDFYHEQHKTIFRAIHTLHYDNKVVDALLVTTTLKNYNRLDEVGGPPYILALIESVTTIQHTSHYIKLLQEMTNKRKLLAVIEQSKANINNPDMTLDDLLNENKSLLDKIRSTNDQNFKSIGNLLDSSIKQIESNSHQKSGITGLRTGFDKLDFTTSGLQKSDLIILAARPAMGKTAFSLNIAKNVAKLNNVNVAIFSLEMSGEQLTNRMISSTSGIQSHKIRSGILGAEEWKELKIAKDNLCELGIYVDDSPGIDIAKLRLKCISLHEENKLGLIVVDYLQLIRGRGFGANRINEVSEVSRTLKEIARELKIPVIALSQLSRAVETRENKRPIMSDLRESGSIEQDADIVVMMYREDYYRKPMENKDGLVEIIFRKHRNGSNDSFKLMFDTEYSLFRNIYHER